MSIMLEKTKYVEVRNNQFSMNAIQVISYKDGSSVYISCNRLLGKKCYFCILTYQFE